MDLGEEYLHDETIMVVFVHEAWKTAHALFGDAAPIRLLAFGRQITQEWPIRYYDQIDQAGNRILKVHIILQLRGGGPKRTPR